MKVTRNPEFKKFLMHTSILSLIVIVILLFINIKSTIIVGLFCIVLAFLYIQFTSKRYEEISKISEEIDSLLHGKRDYDFNNYTEGELSILNNVIQKMVLALRINEENLVKDKVYLANSLADISHQLRTPLTSLNMIASFLAKEDLAEEKRVELSREMFALLSKIDWLVTTLLKISQIDANTVEFKQDRIYIDDVIKESLKPFTIPLEIKDITVIKNISSTCYFVGDMLWTCEAIGNIIKNCIEHTPIGGNINIDCVDNNIYTQITINDNGCGFKEEDIPHLFERFYRGQYNISHSYGIGLSLAQMIINRQEGTIKASNKDGALFLIRFYKSVV